MDLTALAGATPGTLEAGAGTAFVIAEGSVYAWGDGAGGRLGTGATVSAPVPQLSVNLWPAQVRFGGEPGTEARAASRTSIDVLSPAHDAGVVDVQVDFALRADETAGVASLPSLAGQTFTFDAAQPLGKQSSSQSLNPEFSALSLIGTPPNDAPIGSGPAPKMTSTMDPTAYTIPSGTTRTYTVTYENEQASPLTNARLWHQIMSRGDHSTDFTVTCSSQVNSAPGGSCPSWIPAGTQSIPDGMDHEYYLTFAGIFTFAAKQKLTFTIAVTTTVDPAACTETGSAMSGGWARYSAVSFEIEDIEGSASSVGAMSGWTICPPGDIVMTNTVTAPRPPSGDPSRVLSGDARTFQVSWQNTSAFATYTDVDVSYSYYVPYTRQSTAATWTCTATGPSTTCPSFMTGSASVVHNNPGEDADTVFSGTANFAPGQKYTLTVTLATTINTCTQDGYLRVQSYANRAAIGAETSGRQKSSELVEIGCSTWMLDETFSGASVSDSGWQGLSQACLTRAPSGSNPSNGLGYCSNRAQSPQVNFQWPTGTPKGFLQLTDDSNDKVGAALYNRALPSQDGLVVEFTTYQYGNDAEGADGIGFFLADGAYNLSQPGDSGGALGYAYRPTGTSNVFNVNGLAHGYLGVGLDVYGNFVNSAHAAPTSGCTPASPQTPQSVGLRGPGNLRSGYCLISQRNVSATEQNGGFGKRLDLPSANISGTGATYDNRVRDALDAAKRKVRVTVYPLQTGQTHPRVTVEIDFNEGFYRTVIDTTMTAPVPALIKFGFLGATGGSKQVHLVGDVRVGTVLPMKELSLVKAVDYDANADPAKTRFDVGDTVNYQFVVHNGTSDDASGLTDIYNIGVTDPLISNVVCPKTTLVRNESMICKGALVVTEAQRDLGRVVNTGTVQGAISSSEGAPRPLTARSTVEVPVNPEAPDALRVIAPGGVATYQILKYGSTLGMVKPDDPSRITIKLIDPVTGALTDGPITVAGQGTWTIDANNTVKFTPINSSYAGTVTPLKYRASNVYGGWDDGTLSVTISTVPTMVCTAEQHRQSERNWGFGTTARFDFGATGTTVTTGTIPNVASTHGSFTVTDSKGKLLFVVTAGTGAANSAVIRTSTGAIMAGSGATIDNQLFGASPVAVIPAGQGTGKFIVITAHASLTATGQLRWRMVDMAQNGGLGSVGAATAFGQTSASTAVTAVPNADGSGYWVLSPRRGSASIDAYLFDATGYANTTQASSIGTSTAANATLNYEDIRYNTGLANSSGVAQFAALASAGVNGTSRIRLMSFNAATGVLTSVGTNRTMTLGTNLYGYSIEFSPNGSYLYASRNGNTSGVAGVLFRADVTASSLSNSFSTAHATAPSNNNGGAVRLGANGYLYWAQTGTAAVRVKTNPDVNNTTWTSQSLASGSTSTLGLSNTLLDCAIPAAEFALEKYASDGTTLVGGATFALYTDVSGAAGSVVSPGVQPVSGQTGRFTATGLQPGSYWLRETAPATGHQLLPQDVLINISLGGEVAVDTVSNPQVKLVVSGSGNNKTYTIKVTNAKAPALPLTGGNWLHALTVGGAAVLVLAIAGALWWRRRRDRPADDPAEDGAH